MAVPTPESHPSPFPVSGEEEELPDALPLDVTI